MAAPSKHLGDPALVVDEARTARDVLRIRREVRGRQWAARHGIPTATTVAADPEGRWLVSRRAVDEPGDPSDYVVAAFEVARRIQDVSHPPFAPNESAWRAPRRSLGVRVARILRAGIDLRAFVAARSAFEQLPREVTVHNDYHRKNVLRSGPSGVTVIDWELASLGPRHQDLVMLIVDLADDDVAHSAWRALAASVPPEEHGSLAVQLRWLSARTYASDVSAGAHEIDQAQLERRRARWRLAQEWASELATDPREVP